MILVRGTNGCFHGKGHRLISINYAKVIFTNADYQYLLQS
jgi:hypothetical protein